MRNMGFKVLIIIVVLMVSITIDAQEIQVVENQNSWEELQYDKQGELHGKCLAWNADSVLIAEANYLHGVKHGMWRIWYDNGQLAYQMYYSMGRKVGTWKYW